MDDGLRAFPQDWVVDLWSMMHLKCREASGMFLGRSSDVIGGGREHAARFPALSNGNDKQSTPEGQ